MDKEKYLEIIGKNMSLESLKILAEKSVKNTDGSLDKKLKQFAMWI